ncbi:hypothetical protein GGR57DRAFT_478071 [Xylariaceae sp. FL1272]|nr:hypothetical protein GGR57DRAFT_478071 [Xylariaceae sp. FL1272]
MVSSLYIKDMSRSLPVADHEPKITKVRYSLSLSFIVHSFGFAALCYDLLTFQASGVFIVDTFSMKFAGVLEFALALAVGTSNANPLPLEDANVNVARAALCNINVINQCVAATGETSVNCFGHFCAGKELETTKTKRQDQCTEENLNACAIMDWIEAQICFQELCF